MTAIKVLVVFGTRPEAIKMCPLIKELQNSSSIDCRVAVTAQHREMLDQVLDLFRVEPDYDLNIMQHGQSLSDITSRSLKGIQEIIADQDVDLVLVHGDTTTTFAAGLAAFYEKVQVGHVEAGLRTGEKYTPFPEEMNRRLTDVLADFHFAPTITAKQNLLKEGIDERGIFVTGNTVIDALFQTVRKNYIFSENELNNLDFENRRVVLVTAHRRENWGRPMQEIFQTLHKLASSQKDIEIVFPVHKNPELQRLSKDILGRQNSVHLVQPMEYEPFVNLMAKCHIVLTDSGGLQEEAPALGKPVLLMRETTERPEAVAAGTVKLVGWNGERIADEVSRLCLDAEAYRVMSNAANPYGDGKASSRITNWILYRHGLNSKNPLEFTAESG